MPETPFQSIAVRLTRSIVINGLLAALLLCGLVGWWERQAALQRLDMALRVQAQALAHSLPEALWRISLDLAQPQLDAAGRRVGVAYLAMTGVGESRPMAETGPRHLRDRAADIDLPLLRNGIEIGRLKMIFDRTAIDREVYAAMFRSMLASLMLIAMTVALVLLLLRRQLQRPMQALAVALDRVQADDLRSHLELNRPARGSHDEIDQVMAALSALQQRVVRHVDELDARVEERTEQLQMALDKLKVLAITDVLTGCHNRLAFSEKYPEALAHAERYGRPLSLVFCDVDRFKGINDGHGHPIGDQVLSAMGQCLRDALRASSDWVARYGGEEFVLVLPETTLPQAQEVAERLRQQIEETLAVALPDGQALRVTASLGVAEYRSGERAEDLLTRADTQLYAAKQAGRNQVQPPVAVTAA